jgi:hypothetical protein
VRVIEQNVVVVAQAGTGSSGESLHTANRPGTVSKRRVCFAVIIKFVVVAWPTTASCKKDPLAVPITFQPFRRTKARLLCQAICQETQVKTAQN